jgi:hypothetical protein
LTFALHILLSTSAYAGPGDHIQVGPTTFTPRLTFGVDHDTNAFYSESTPISGTSARIVPGLDISSNNENVEYSLSSEYRMHKYFQANTTNLDRFNEFGVRGNLNIAKQSVVGLLITEDVGLRNTPSEAPSSSRPFQTQLRQTLDGGLLIRPTSAIQLRLGGMWTFDDFRVPYPLDNGSTAFNRSNTFGPKGEVSWNFFPNTAVVVTGSYEMTRWTDNLVDLPDQSDISGDELAVPDSNQFRIWAGMRGRVTKKLVVQLMAGYGSGQFLEQSVDENGAPSANYATDVSGIAKLLIDTQIRWSPAENNQVTLGYQRDFRDVYFTNYSQFNYLYLRGAGRFGKFGASGEVGGRLEAYRGQIVRNDLAPSARLDGAYYLKDWMNLSVGVGYSGRASTDPEIVYNDVNVHGLFNVVY